MHTATMQWPWYIWYNLYNLLYLKLISVMFIQPLSVLIMFCSDSNQVHCSAASGRILWAAFPPIVYINQWGLFAPMRRHFIGLGTSAQGLLSRSQKVIYRPATLNLSCESVSRHNVKVEGSATLTHIRITLWVVLLLYLPETVHY